MFKLAFTLDFRSCDYNSHSGPESSASRKKPVLRAQMSGMRLVDLCVAASHGCLSALMLPSLLCAYPVGFRSPSKGVTCCDGVLHEANSVGSFICAVESVHLPGEGRVAFREAGDVRLGQDFLQTNRSVLPFPWSLLNSPFFCECFIRSMWTYRMRPCFQHALNF